MIQCSSCYVCDYGDIMTNCALSSQDIHTLAITVDIIVWHAYVVKCNNTMFKVVMTMVIGCFFVIFHYNIQLTMVDNGLNGY